MEEKLLNIYRWVIMRKHYLMILLLLFLCFAVKINFNQRIRTLDNISEGFKSIGNKSDMILARLKEKDEKDSIRDVIINHLPTGAPISPVAMTRISSTFSVRIDPITKERKLHTGIDYAAPIGTEVFATGDGIVEEADMTAGYGKMVKIDHQNGYETFYGHLSEIDCYKGKEVKKGEKIGLVGSTGMSTGSHLHYQEEYLKKPFNPNSFNQYGTMQ